jgi:integrase
VRGDPIYKRCRCRDDDDKDLNAKCPKLKKADGTWNPRHGRWAFRLELPAGPGGKRRTPLRQSGFRTRDDAEAAREAAKEKLRKGADPSLRLTTGQYLDSWLAGRRDLKRSTRTGYEKHIRIYLKPLLGHIPLDRLSSSDVSEMFDTISEWNDELAEGVTHHPNQVYCGPVTWQRIRATLRAALSDAIRDGKIPYNPASRLRMPAERKVRPTVWTAARTAEFWTRLEASIDDGMLPHDKFKAWRRKELRPGKVMVWTPEQTGQFLDHVAADRLSALFELVVDTGTRRGEFTGLRWIDVDLDNGVIDVTHTRVTIGWEVIDETPKSEAGERSVPISQSTVAALRKWRAQQSRERLAWGEAWVDSGLVFTREDGSPLHPGVVSNHFRRLAYDAGLPPVALHGMRHGSATYLLAAGVDVKVVQARLGHSTSTLTRDTYTSVLDEVARAAAEAAAAMIPRAATGTLGHPTDTHTGTRSRGLRPKGKK